MRETINFLGDDLTFELGHYAYKADAALTLQKGETVVLVTVTSGKMPIDANFLPLSVEYIEKYYAGGIISSSRFVKREMRPSDDATLKARQVDHAIRSLFPKSWRKPISVVITVLAYDHVNDPEQLAVIGASTALMLSSVPFAGPSASIKLGIDNSDQFIWGPNEKDEENLKLDMIFSIVGERVLNIEGWADEVPEAQVIEGMQEAVERVQPILEFQKDLAAKHGAEKQEHKELPASQEMITRIEEDYSDKITFALTHKEARVDTMNELKADLAEKLAEELALADSDEKVDTDAIEEATEYVARKILRAMVLEESKRPSGRSLDQIRPLKIEVGALPRVHGSAVFTRGMTQSLTVLTLGSTRLAQTLESFEGEEEKRFMHHYSSPNYSYGDAGRFSYYPGRREIGHGHIGENGLLRMIPSEREFPYTIRLSSEIMSSNGSTSMAATCASTLALLDGGVPIKNKVAGVAMGLVTDDDDLSNYKILTDMEDVEDFYGDMDFKVTGTDKGVTAIQMDNKLKGVPADILADAFEQSRVARLQILEEMSAVIPAPRETLSAYAPKFEVIEIDPEQIPALIGPSGKTIKGVIAHFGNRIDIDIQDSGLVYLMAVNEEDRRDAVEMINLIVGNLEQDKIYDAVVGKVVDYGIFVDIAPGVGGLVHVKKLGVEGYVENVGDHFSEGQEVKVRYVGKDERDRLELSMEGIDNKSTGIEQSEQAGQANGGNNGDEPTKRVLRRRGSDSGPNSESAKKSGMAEAEQLQ